MNRVEKIKEKYRRQLENDAQALSASVIRELDYLYRKFGASTPLSNQVSTNNFANNILSQLRIPNAQKNRIVRNLNEAQKEINSVWKDYFANSTSSVTDYKINDYEKLKALYNVDFPKIDKDIRDKVVKEVRGSARTGLDFNKLRIGLQTSKIARGQVYTLANTAVAQFDNASMFEFAKQAGTKYFKYSGMLNPNTRDFCRKHLGKIYTLEQIEAMDNGQGLSVMSSCGGYNCTHYWIPATPEEVKAYFNRAISNVKAKNISEAERFAKENNFAKSVSYRGLSVDTANSINKAFLELKNKKQPFNLDKIKTVNRKTWEWQTTPAFHSVNNMGEYSISFNRGFFDRFNSAKELKEYIFKAHSKNKWVPKDVEGIVYHEVGHNLTFINKDFNSILAFKKQFANTHNNSISKYGSTSGTELIAEAFVKLMYGESIPSDIQNLIIKHTEIK